NVDDGSCLFLGCTDPEADNFDPQANFESGDCEYWGCTNPDADNYDPDANVDNGFCVVLGCTDPAAANYNPDANTNNGNCLYGGCLDPAYMEYDPTVDVDDGSCLTLIVDGCTDPAFTEFNAEANVDDGSCSTPVVEGCTDPNFLEFDPAANTYDGSCMTPVISGCTNPFFTEYNEFANTDDGSCATPVEEGCTDSSFLEYNPQANTDDGSCETPVVVGCLEELACNYNADANTAGDCQYPEDIYGVNFVDCDGACLNDLDEDGICDQEEVGGCTDSDAVNYSADATDEDGSCLYGGCIDSDYIEYDPTADVDDGSCQVLVFEGCTDPDYLEYNAEANVDDGSCSELVIYGCTDPTACNFSGGYNTDDGSCIYADQVYGSDLVDCFGNCFNDADGDGVCDEEELGGCTDNGACNYSEIVTEDDGSCGYCSCYEPEIVSGPDTLYFESDSAGYGAKLVRVMEHVGGDLDGLTTYRLYVTAASEDDKLSSVFGNGELPLNLNTSTSWYQEGVGSNYGSAINPLLFNFMPSLEYDSWVTIGIEQTPNTALGQAEVQAVSSPGQNWLAAFSSGGGIDIDDATGGAWFVTNDATNGIAGENLDVLVAQLTTDGEINGVINFQLFLGGDPNVDIRPTVAVSSAGMASSMVSICGCTNPESENYSADAIYDDGSCGAAPGCTYPTALNYNPLALGDNGTCLYSGCTVDYYRNYTTYATVDDGNCTDAPPCPDSNGDGSIGALEITDLLVYYNTDGGGCGILNPLSPAELGVEPCA
ncbi:MAG: hypothetical protein L7U25_02825, partial [Candidatus Poseidonia sp.]|nr:hypothetical protein [Poseidonia sp.]